MCAFQVVVQRWDLGGTQPPVAITHKNWERMEGFVVQGRSVEGVQTEFKSTIL